MCTTVPWACWPPQGSSWWIAALLCAAGTVEEAFMRWLRAAELTCDRAALLVAQDARVVISALMKLAGGSPAFANELNVDAFLEQVGVALCTVLMSHCQHIPLKAHSMHVLHVA